MRVVLSTIGSRGEVEPVTGLALRLRESGAEVRVCAPPDFGDRLTDLGFAFTPVGPEVNGTATAPPPTPAQVREATAETVRAQFEAISEAARGSDALLGAGGRQIAAHSIAESLGIHYVYAAFCAVTLPSPHHPPLIMPEVVVAGEAPPDEATGNAERWAADAQRWNSLFAEALNTHRDARDLSPVDDVRGHVVTDRPWLAADQVLGPWPEPGGVFQTGAWTVPDDRPLPAGVEDFLRAGEPPVYFGFGSTPATPELGAAVVAAARAVGRRAIVAGGWAGLTPDEGTLPIGETNHQALFPRVAAVVHHGGAGTTAAAARAGVPQVVVPRRYDQPYWARRVVALGIGTEGTSDSVATALARALSPVTVGRAAALAPEVRTDGTLAATCRLLSLPTT
ncbi:glycosyltransferase [Actinosynnema sp. NPDC047251]|uniref:Glycosyltransferase, family 1 n=1 Tax=Saccharothrix espanaensis (strain ATCC 51144 / DSM 44229 / JCM 9112 / NBRC 15066 / NRRL 15764) TaxID=1179773 RepID=K0K1G7_SACES|nr:glycosyltransferase [Saccharothrix espanaensis]CCH34065.1 Glycosyltransferase, family 1 [Saccharothrix espanaensis DSM 44229]